METEELDLSRILTIVLAERDLDMVDDSGQNIHLEPLDGFGFLFLTT